MHHFDRVLGKKGDLLILICLNISFEGMMKVNSPMIYELRRPKRIEPDKNLSCPFHNAWNRK
ncbi:hypothetical protein GCM10020331_065190 [Ectobacillus funiculus]